MTSARDKPRLLIVTSTFPASSGDGIARFVLDLAESLSVHYDVRVLAPHVPGAAVREVLGGVEVRRFRYFWPSALERLAGGGGMRSNVSQSRLAFIQVPLFLMCEFLAMVSQLIVWRPRAVNTHWLIPQGVIGAILCKATRVRHVLHVHAADVYILEGKPFSRWLVQRVLESSDAIFADGSHVRAALLRLAGRPFDVVVRPMGVWTQRFGRARVASQRTDEFILFVGRLVEKKGVTFLVEAMRTIRRSHPRLRLVVVGDGPLRAQLESQAESLGLGRDIEFIGTRSHDDIVALLGCCLVACVPSIVDSHGETEGMPTVVVEALAAGALVVGTRVDGIPDVLKDRVNGWLCEPEDPTDLARVILQALSDSRSAHVRKHAIRTAQTDHDWSRVADIYREAIEPPRSGA